MFIVSTATFNNGTVLPRVIYGATVKLEITKLIVVVFPFFFVKVTTEVFGF